MEQFEFPRWTNKLRHVLGATLTFAPVYLVMLFWIGASPKTMAVGYAPEQPVPYSHKIHAGELGMDCRYCHTTVFDSARASIPSTEVCLNCHKQIRAESPRLQAVRDSAASGDPIRWVRVHDLPDYVYFDHSAHVNRGVGCVSCHGRVDNMEVVTQQEMLSMGWCLDCHRNPDPHLRPQDRITDLAWKPADPDAGRRIREARNIRPSQDCSTCHR